MSKQGGFRVNKLSKFLAPATASRVASTASRVGAIRLDTRQHLAATLFLPGLALTCSRSLPEQDRYLLLLNHGHAIAHLLRRDPDTGLALLRLDVPVAMAEVALSLPASAGALVVLVGADETGQGVAALATLEAVDGLAAEESNRFGLDRSIWPEDAGGAVIAASGALIGVVVSAGNGSGRVVQHDAIRRLLGPELAVPDVMKAGEAGAGEAGAANGLRGWLGANLQPVAVPVGLRGLAKQSSGRLVLNVVTHSPGFDAGLVPGDIVLSIADRSMVGFGSIRKFVAERASQTLKMVLLREGRIARLDVVLGELPSA